MSLLRDIASEIIGMFLSDARLSAAIFVLVLLVAILSLALDVGSLIAGGVLLLGCLAVLIEAAWREARHGRRGG